MILPALTYYKEKAKITTFDGLLSVSFVFLLDKINIPTTPPKSPITNKPGCGLVAAICHLTTPNSNYYPFVPLTK